MTETPNPTPDEVLEELSEVGGRISLAQQEIVRRLEQILPGVIRVHNAAESYAPKDEVPQPDKIEIAPSFVGDDSFINKVLVGVSVETRPEGIGGAFINEAQVAIYSVDKAIKTGQQVVVHWERAELIRGCLRAFMSGCVDQKGRRVWRSLVPGPYMILPAEMATDYSGTVCHFTLLQVPGEDNLWG